MIPATLTYQQSWHLCGKSKPQYRALDVLGHCNHAQVGLHAQKKIPNLYKPRGQPLF